LASQNGDYLLQQLENFADGSRANDINEPMRSIASALTDSERHAIAAYYGGGEGRFQWAPPWAQARR
jgi:cytochrome c553